MESCWNLFMALHTPALTGFSRASPLSQKNVGEGELWHAEPPKASGGSQGMGEPFAEPAIAEDRDN
jgi:hypothetical protein